MTGRGRVCIHPDNKKIITTDLRVPTASSKLKTSNKEIYFTLKDGSNTRLT